MTLWFRFYRKYVLTKNEITHCKLSLDYAFITIILFLFWWCLSFRNLSCDRTVFGLLRSVLVSHNVDTKLEYSVYSHIAKLANDITKRIVPVMSETHGKVMIYVFSKLGSVRHVCARTKVVLLLRRDANLFITMRFDPVKV